MKNTLIISFFFIAAFINSAKSQVEVNGTITFTSPNDSLRNFYNVASPDSLTEAVRTTEFAYQKSMDDEVSISDSCLVITTTFEFPPYTAGMNLFVTVPLLTDTVNTPGYLRINQQNAIPIKTINQALIDNKLMKKNNVLILVFDGSDFIAINTPVYKCPGGFKKITDKYCIQINRNPMATFWNAHKDCNDQGYHLCTFQEWYYACVHNTGLANLPQNFEWVHSSSNHNIHALKVGAGSNCQGLDSETTATTGLPMYYRCCYHIR